MLFTQKLFQDFVAGFDTLGYAPGTPAPAGSLAFLLGGKFRQVFCDSLDLPTTFRPRIWTAGKLRNTHSKYGKYIHFREIFFYQCDEFSKQGQFIRKQNGSQLHSTLFSEWKLSLANILPVPDIHQFTNSKCCTKSF